MMQCMLGAGYAAEAGAHQCTQQKELPSVVAGEGSGGDAGFYTLRWFSVTYHHTPLTLVMGSTCLKPYKICIRSICSVLDNIP